MFYVIDAENTHKVEALKKVLSKIPEKDITFSPIRVDGMPDVRPLSEREARMGAMDGVIILMNFFKKKGYTKKTAIAVCIQKGVDLETNSLIAYIAFYRSKDGRIWIQECERIPISPQIRELVQAGVPIYKAYGKVYGDAVEQKKISLIEVVRSDLSEVDWLAHGIEKGIEVDDVSEEVSH